jgi:alpha-tubulin suppressor-like RCC1 family protein
LCPWNADPPASDPCSSVPVPVSGGLSFTSLTVGGGHNCGLTAGGRAYCWGSNYAAVLGNGNQSDSPTPVPVAGGLTFAALSAGGGHTCGITNQGETYCWGGNLSDELGVDPTTRNDCISLSIGFQCIATPLKVGGQR